MPFTTARKNMLNSISWLISVVCTVLGIAGTLVLGALVVLFAALLKKLPVGIRRFISATAAVIVTMTLFRVFALHNLAFLGMRQFIFCGVSLKSFDIVLVISALLMVKVGGYALFEKCAVSPAVVTPPSHFENYCPSLKKQSSSSFLLKFSSVQIQ